VNPCFIKISHIRILQGSVVYGRLIEHTAEIRSVARAAESILAETSAESAVTRMCAYSFESCGFSVFQIAIHVQL
jgi:hypothetical protein